MTAHNEQFQVLRKRQTHGLPWSGVLVRSSRTKHNYHYRIGQGTRTDVSLGGGERITLDHRFRITIHERPVESTLRAAEPFDPDVSRAPHTLDAILVPFADRLHQVERTTVPEVQPCPHPHAAMIREGSK